MISLVLPYWQRQAVTNAALARLAQHYRGLDLEVVVVDDGDPVPFAPPQGLPLQVVVKRLPEKSEPKDPGLAINRGVEAAAGEHIAISGPEMMHTAPILAAMREEIEAGGPETYVTAAAWFPDGKTWHAHSSIAGGCYEGVQMPAGAHFHFMTMLHRRLWERCDGFDEEYRDGAGYDDPDFLLRLKRAGARFVMRDDLVVEHTRQGARSRWTPAMFERNRKLFASKWG